MPLWYSPLLLIVGTPMITVGVLLWMFYNCIWLASTGLTRGMPTSEGFLYMVGVFSFFAVWSLDFYFRKDTAITYEKPVSHKEF